MRTIAIFLAWATDNQQPSVLKLFEVKDREGNEHGDNRRQMLLLTYLVSLHHYSKIFAVHQIKLQIRSPQSVLCVLEDSILHEAERTFQYRKDNNMHASPSED